MKRRQNERVVVVGGAGEYDGLNRSMMKWKEAIACCGHIHVHKGRGGWGVFGYNNHTRIVLRGSSSHHTVPKPHAQ